MKKFLFCVAVFVTLATLSACGGKPAKSGESVVQKPAEQYADFRLKEATLKTADRYESEGIAVDITGISYEDVVTKVELCIKNETENTVRVVTANLSINEMMCTDSLFCEISPKSQQDAAIEISNEWFGKMDISVIKEMEFVIKVFDTDNNEIQKSGVLRCKTNAPFTYRQKYDDSGVEIYKSNGVKILARALQKSALSDDMELIFYVENNTDSAISIMSYDVSVNEIPVDPLFVMSVGAGKKAVDTMVFYDKELKQNNILGLETVVARFKAFNEQLETVFDTEPVKVPIGG